MGRSRRFVFLTVAVACLTGGGAISQEQQSEAQGVDAAQIERRLNQLEMSHEVLLQWQEAVAKTAEEQVDLAIEKVTRRDRLATVILSVAAAVSISGVGALWRAYSRVRMRAVQDFDRNLRRMLSEEHERFSEVLADAWRHATLRTNSSVLIVLPPAEVSETPPANRNSRAVARHVKAFLKKTGYSDINTRETENISQLNLEQTDLVLICDAGNQFHDEEIDALADNNGDKVFLLFAPHASGKRKVRADNINFANSLITLDHQAIACLQFAQEHAAGFRQLE